LKVKKQLKVERKKIVESKIIEHLRNPTGFIKKIHQPVAWGMRHKAKKIFNFFTYS